jgi:hypothetical protein
MMMHGLANPKVTMFVVFFIYTFILFGPRDFVVVKRGKGGHSKTVIIKFTHLGITSHH